MRLSYSELATYRRCPRAYYYRTVMKLQRKRRSVTLYLGSAVHRLLLGWHEQAYVGLETEATAMLKEVEEKAPLLFDDELASQKDVLREAGDIVARYIKHWGYEEDLIPCHIEEEFTLHLGDLEITFTPDLVARAAGSDAMVIFDHKTCARLPEKKLWTMQSLLYTAGVKQYYPQLTGFYFNYIRKKAPAYPRFTKDMRKVADIGRLDTDFTTLYEFVSENKPDLLKDAAVQRRLKELQGPSNFYRRDFLPYRESASEQALDEAQVTAEQIEADELWPRTYIESGYHDCAHCEFNSLCTAELLDYDSDLVLANEYEPREPKNVYESEGEE